MKTILVVDDDEAKGGPLKFLKSSSFFNSVKYDWQLDLIDINRNNINIDFAWIIDYQYDVQVY